MIFVVRHLSQGVVNAEFVLPKGGIIRFGSGGDVDFELTAFLDFPSVCGTEMKVTMDAFSRISRGGIRLSS